MSEAIEPVEKKSWVQQFVARANSAVQTAAPREPLSYAREAGTAISEFATGGALGALLGATHARFGLDTRVGAIDAWAAGLGVLGGVALSGHLPQLAAAARKAGGQAFAIYTFRKSYGLVKREPLHGGTGAPAAIHGERVTRIAAPGQGPGVSAVDRIEAAAARLDG